MLHALGESPRACIYMHESVLTFLISLDCQRRKTKVSLVPGDIRIEEYLLIPSVFWRTTVSKMLQCRKGVRV